VIYKFNLIFDNIYLLLFLYNFCYISEQHILREELKALQTLNVRLTQKASEVEEELKKTKQELEQIKVNKSDSDVININIFVISTN